jgi:hypothetical protein
MSERRSIGKGERIGLAIANVVLIGGALCTSNPWYYLPIALGTGALIVLTYGAASRWRERL